VNRGKKQAFREPPSPPSSLQEHPVPSPDVSPEAGKYRNQQRRRVANGGGGGKAKIRLGRR